MNRAVAALTAGAVRLLTGARVSWRGCRPEARPRVYFGNHSSHLDAVLVWAALPGECRRHARPVAARDYWDRPGPARRLLTRLSGAVLIDRDNADVGARERQTEAMLQAMGGQGSLIVFPEGTRGSGPDVGPFKSGLYHLARRRPGLELVPVHLHNVHRILPKGALLPVLMTCAVTFGPPLAVGPDEGKEAFLERAREAVRRLTPATEPD
jgi:1-acyl-sn-glycerol-3-phosphate acyltransferase